MKNSNKLELKREHFINQYPPFNLINATAINDMNKKEELLFYVHIPFCPTKCGYCYYKSIDRHSEDIIEKYLSDLKKEIELYKQSGRASNKVIRSLYLGGGTPTILTCKQYEGLVTFIKDRFDFADDFEFCSEARPHEKTLNQEKLSLMKKLGVTRLSLGMQSLDNKILELNKREANVEFYLNIFETARKIGFNYINVDIMSGMFGETWDTWNNTIDKLLIIQPESIAIYKMELFLNTQLYKLYNENKNNINFISNEEEIVYIQHAHSRLNKEANYKPINCLHLAKDIKFRDIHYTSLWKGTDMKGFGLSSHSCENNFLYQNSSGFNEYSELVNKSILPVKRAYKLTIRDRISEAMVYGLKNLHVDRNDFIKRFGFDFVYFYKDVINELVEMGYLICTDDELSVKSEYSIFADDICRQFFLPEYETMMLAHTSRI